uniref:Uncharacterized protein n=1 Tax=Anguilla anguilla TaxID=7936 RepID=A0A0E9W2B5_ANGAN
MQTRALTAK